MRSSSETIFEGLATYVVTTWPVTFGRNDGRKRWGWEARIKGASSAGRAILGCGTADDRRDAAIAAAKAAIDAQEARLRRRNAASGRTSSIVHLHSEFDRPWSDPRSLDQANERAWRSAPFGERRDRVPAASSREKPSRPT